PSLRDERRAVPTADRHARVRRARDREELTLGGEGGGAPGSRSRRGGPDAGRRTDGQREGERGCARSPSPGPRHCGPPRRSPDRTNVYHHREPARLFAQLAGTAFGVETTRLLASQA